MPDDVVDAVITEPTELPPVGPRFNVVCVTDGQATRIETCIGEAELSTRVLAFREQQRSDLSVVTHLYIFEGKQWFIMKGPAWQLTDCDRIISLEPIPESVRCEDGGLRDPAPPEHILPPPQAAGEVSSSAESEVPAPTGEDDDEFMPESDGSSDATIEG